MDQNQNPETPPNPAASNPEEPVCRVNDFVDRIRHKKPLPRYITDAVYRTIREGRDDHLLRHRWPLAPR